MAAPTIESRLRRRMLLMTPREPLAERVRESLPPAWELVVSIDVASVGGVADVLQLRIVLLDLDPFPGWSPVDAVADIRSERMLNVPILCCGGDVQTRDQARLARADRFFDEDVLIARLPGFCAQFGW